MQADSASNAAVRQIMSLPIASIAIGERIGFFNAPHSQHLAERMAAEGQHDPIHVKRNGNAAKQRWTLVAGLHRLRGAEAAGWTAIDAIQVADAGSTPATLRRLELSENMDHRQRRPIERAIFMVELARLEEEADHPGRAGEARADRAARVRWNGGDTDACVTMTLASDWRDRAASALTCSVSTLARYQRVHREIVEALDDIALVQRLNDHPLGESMSAMLRIGSFKLPAGDATRGDPYRLRRQIVEAIVADEAILSVDEAYARVTNGPRKGDREPFNDDRGAELIGRTWKKLGPAGRRTAFAALIQGADLATLRAMRTLLDAAPVEGSKA